MNVGAARWLGDETKIIDSVIFIEWKAIFLSLFLAFRLRHADRQLIFRSRIIMKMTCQKGMVSILQISAPHLKRGIHYTSKSNPKRQREKHRDDEQQFNVFVLDRLNLSLHDRHVRMREVHAICGTS